MSVSSREHAGDLPVHYFRQAYRSAGLRWGSDNDTEVRLIADHIPGAAYEEYISDLKTQVSELRQRIGETGGSS